MTLKEMIKELMKINLDELNFTFGLKIEIKFNNDEFIVLDGSKVVLKDEILNYGLSYDEQKKFIFNVAKNLFSFFKDEESIEYKKIEIDNILTFKVVCYNEYMFIKHTIKVKNNKTKELTDEEFEKYMKKLYNKIAFNLDWNKISVVNEIVEYDDYFHINIVINEEELLINYIDYEDLDVMSNIINSVKRLLKSKYLTVCYSNVDEKEADKAVDYIRSLIEDESLVDEIKRGQDDC